MIAAFTTAYAVGLCSIYPHTRLNLYELLDTLQDRVLYCDTDLIIYVSKLGEPELPLGPDLGQLTDELKGEHITTFTVSGGPTNYAYRSSTGKVKLKISELH